MSVLDNAELTFKIKSALVTELGAGGVNVDSSDGTVTLRGQVAYADIKKAAEEIALRCGARRVVNELTFDASRPLPETGIPATFPGVTTSEGGPVIARSMLEEAVREALEADSRVNMHLVTVRVEDDTVYLSGRQDTVQAVEAAGEVAAHVPGVVGIVNDLEVLPSY
jgi:osmotically-inducible protein OsmY